MTLSKTEPARVIEAETEGAKGAGPVSLWVSLWGCGEGARVEGFGGHEGRWGKVVKFGWNFLTFEYDSEVLGLGLESVL